ncbi:MAG: DUF1669 domain-containing protein [Candidatus Wallbacteria bacterium]|nr:DUF1669 domain-containing protein [Candidatus Wallbacteria bacterium]
MRTVRSTALVTLLGLALALVLPASELGIFFGPRKPGDPNGLDTQTVKLIQTAKKRINAAVHELRLQSITDALIAAHKKGVQVRMVGEDKYYDNDFMKQIRAAGIPTKSDENPNAIMHNKFLVIDGIRMQTGSYNLTDTCSYNNYNNLVIIEDAAVSKIFDDEFEQLWAGHIYDETVNGDVHKATLKLKDREVEVEVFFQPRNQDSEETVLERLNTSKQAIDVMQFAFFNGKVGKLLVDKFTGKQDVKAVIDYSMVFGDFEPYNQIGRLVEGQIPFCIGDDPNGKLHHKVFVVDPDTDNAMVLTGSANSSSAGFNKNAENIIVLHDQKVAQMYRDECVRLLHRRDAGQVTIAPRGLTGIGTPQHFDITVDSGGKPMQDIELSLPFHWRVGSAGDLSASKDGQANVRTGLALQTRIPSRYTTIPVQVIVFKGANLTASGAGAKAIVRVKNLHMDPETLPGKYCIYARGSGSDGNLVALPQMPLIYLFRTSAENVGFMAKLLESKDIRASKDLEFLMRDVESSLEKDIEKGDVSALKDFVFLAEKAQKDSNPRYKLVQPAVSPLLKKINFAAGDSGPNADTLKQLAARLKALAGSRGE